MPECTEAERAYLEACLSAGVNPGSGLLDGVAKERLTPELREAAIAAHIGTIRAHRIDSAVWERIEATGVHGSARIELYRDIEDEAEKRIDAPKDPEPIEPASTGRLRQ
jgi:hypothetical protein